MGLISVHMDIVPVVDFRQRLHLPKRVWGPDTRLLLVHVAGLRVALPVDEVLGVSELELNNLHPAPLVRPDGSLLEGVVSIGDGLVFLFDLDAVLSLEEFKQLQISFGGVRS
jgi:chemotaxis signal transduction protein